MTRQTEQASAAARLSTAFDRLSHRVLSAEETAFLIEASGRIDVGKLDLRRVGRLLQAALRLAYRPPEQRAGDPRMDSLSWRSDVDCKQLATEDAEAMRLVPTAVLVHLSATLKQYAPTLLSFSALTLPEVSFLYLAFWLYEDCSAVAALMEELVSLAWVFLNPEQSTQ